MLFQPTNIIPDELNNSGVVDLTNGLQVSWQVNGDSPMTGYAITIKRYQAESESSITFSNVVSAFWGRDYNGDIERFYVTIPATILSSNNIVNGYDYSINITQYWEENNEQKDVKQLASSVFHARTSPTLTLASIGTLTSREHTFTATYSQEQGDAINSIRWILAQANYEDDPIKDTGNITGTGILQFYYNGFLNNNTYMIRCIVTTQYGAEADTGWHSFNVSYSVAENTGTVTVCQSKDENSVLIDWRRYGSATLYTVMRREVGQSQLEKVADVVGNSVEKVKDYGAKSGKSYQYYVFPSSSSAYLTTAMVSDVITVNYKHWAILETTKYSDGVYSVVKAFYFQYGEGGIKEGKLSNNNSPGLLQNFTRYPTRQGSSQNYKTGSLTGLLGTVNKATREYRDTVEEADDVMALSTSRNILFLSDPKGHFLQIHIKDAITLQGSVSKRLMPQTITIPWVEVGNSEKVSVISMLSTRFRLFYSANGGQNAPSDEERTKRQSEFTFIVSNIKPTRSGYVFDVWNTKQDGSGKSYVAGSRIIATATEPDVYLYAQWFTNSMRKYTIQYVFYYGTSSQETVDEYLYAYGASVQMKLWDDPSSYYDPTQGNFLGWSESPTATTPTYAGGSKVTLPYTDRTKILYPVYDGQDPATYRYSLYYTTDLSEGETVTNFPENVFRSSNENRFYMGKVSSLVPVRNPVGSGSYTFMGWEGTFGDGVWSSYIADEDIWLTAEKPTLQLKAQWSATYTLHYDANAGSDTVTGMPTDPPAQFDNYRFLISSQTPTRNGGYEFLYWSDNPTAGTGGIYRPGNTYSFSAINTTLYAIWQDPPTPVNYTLHFNKNAGSDSVSNMPSDITNNTAEFVIPDNIPDRGTGWTFLGWNEDSTAQSASVEPGWNYTWEEALITEKTLYAIWEVKQAQFTLTFDKNNSSTTYNLPNDMTAPQTTSSHTFTIPENVPYLSSMESRMFMGWDTSSDGTGTRYAEGDTITLTISDPTKTLYAIWEMPSYYYTLSFNANGGTGAPGSLTQGDQITTVSFEIPSTVPTKDSAIFAGWADSPGASELDVYEESIPVSATPYPTRLLGMIWEQGTLDTVANNGVEKASSTTIRTDGYMNFNYIGNKQVRIKCPYGTRMYLYSYTKSGDTYTCQSNRLIDGASRITYYTFAPETDYYYRLVAWNSSGGALTPDSSKVENINMSYTVDKTVYAIWIE